MTKVTFEDAPRVFAADCEYAGFDEMQFYARTSRGTHLVSVLVPEARVRTRSDERRARDRAEAVATDVSQGDRYSTCTSIGW